MHTYWATYLDPELRIGRQIGKVPSVNGSGKLRESMERVE